MNLALIGALALAVLIPVGCSRPAAPRTTILRIANWGGAGDDDKLAQLNQQIYAEFEKENPGVELRVENVPDEYVSKMILSFVAHAEPDIMMLDASSAAVFINNGVLTDLTPFVDAERTGGRPAPNLASVGALGVAREGSSGGGRFSLDDYFPNAVNVARRGRALYAIPQDFTPMVVYYNKRMFDRAGIPYPKPGWNFEQFLETARKLTIAGDNPGDPPKQSGFVFSNWMPGWVMWLWNNGGDVLSPDGRHAEGVFDSPQNVQTIQFLSDLVNKYRVAPSLSAAAALGVDPFANGQAAMTVSGHWSMVGYASAPKDANGKPKIAWDDLGVVELPHNTPQPHTVEYESGYAIGKNCRQKQLAWKFIKYMTSYRVQILYNQSGIAVDGRKDVARERSKNPLEAEFLPIIPSSRPPWGSKVVGYDFVEHEGGSMIDSILQNGEPVQAALTKAAKAIDFEFSKD